MISPVKRAWERVSAIWDLFNMARSHVTFQELELFSVG